MAKLSIIDIGHLLIDNIINIKNDNNKIKLLSVLKNYNKDILDKKEDIIKRSNMYITKYDMPRKNNKNNYDKFLRAKGLLFNKWKQSKKVKDLYELISLQQSEYIEVPDIYTISATK
jgi:hypothetical protein